MDSFEFNKIAGAVLATALGVMALSIVSEVIFHPAEAVQPGYVVANVEATGDEHGSAAAPVSDLPPIAVRLATADLGAGERSMAKCKACHTLDEGNTRKTPGPNLWGVVGGPVAHLQGFAYSAAMMAKHDEGVTWTFENLDQFLLAPKTFIPGTAMTFAGLKRDDERTNVIAYLRTLSGSPVPLPEAPTAAATDDEAVEPAAPPAAEPPPAEPAPPPAESVPPAPAGGTAPEAPAE
jgi:cytochrome c